MADRLTIDTVALREAGAALRTVASEFDSASATSGRVADAVGHPGLRDALRGFALGWDDVRADLVAGVAGLADACTGIGEGFEQIDTEFAAALLGQS